MAHQGVERLPGQAARAGTFDRETSPMRRRDLLAAGAAAAMAGGLARPALGQGAKVLRFVPQANLASPDPVWTTTVVAFIHGFMIWDTLYGLDEQLNPQPQMAAGHEESADGLTFTITLRDGLKFTDGEPVRARDCVQSIIRWSKRNPMGSTLMARCNELVALDDKRLQFRMKKRFPVTAYVLGGEPCFIMPERIAKTDAYTQVSEYVGSGPYKFLRDEWVSGASAAYARNADYVPRQEAPSMWAGAKIANFDRVEWKIMPDPATAAAALQRGEVDWWENPLPDLVPQLRRAPGLKTDVLDPLGALGVIRFNQLFPPFDNAKLRRALLPAIDQKDFLQAYYGDLTPDLGRTGAGFFTAGSPCASDVGMEALNGSRDLALAKKLVAESGYKGEEIVLMSPTDQANLQAMAQVTNDLFQKLGLNVKYEAMDWGTLVSRRAKKDPPDKGGWNVFCTTWTGLSVANPGSSQILRGNGGDGWFGWPTMPDMEKLRDAWFDAPDLAAQQKICRDMQALAFQEVPVIPTGMWFTPTAYRSNLTGLIKSGIALMWGIKRV
jgi:peptide/nickel transport system substrate-binding protein